MPLTVGARVTVVFGDGVPYRGSVLYPLRKGDWVRVRFDDGDVFDVSQAVCGSCSRPEPRPSVRIGPNFQAQLPALGSAPSERNDRRLSEKEILSDVALVQ